MRIKEVLKKYGITQDEIAKRLGINRVSVNRLLSDKNDMRVSTAEKFAAAIGCSIGELFEDKENKLPDSGEICAFIRYKGIHYTADTLEDFNKIVEDVRSIAK